MSELSSLSQQHGTDKIQHGYCPHYETHFGPIREQVTKVLELGVYRGRSLLMWRDYFPNAQIHGVDIDPTVPKNLGDRITVHTMSQDDPRLADLGDFDIVIDDASHIVKLILASWNILASRTKRFYVIEDMLLSYGYDIPKTDHWPGMRYNNLPNEYWKNHREDVDKFMTERISDVDNKKGWSSVHVYNMIYFFQR